MKLLTKKELKMAKFGGWKLLGNTIRKQFIFADFACAMGFVNSVALYAERANHHPDIDIRWNKVTLSLSTHSEGGITDKDISLAKRIDTLVN
jgi:4a-hydroxytetrahydrobiopterin dehydratase